MQLSFLQRLGIGASALALDQGSKWLVQRWRPDWLQLNQVGALSQDFFGLGTGFWLVLTGIVLIALSMVALRSTTLSSLPTALLIGGGLSNWLDRWLYGGVRDWLVIPGTALKNNLADYALTAAVVVWLWQNLFTASPATPESKKQ